MATGHSDTLWFVIGLLCFKPWNYNFQRFTRYVSCVEWILLDFQTVMSTHVDSWLIKLYAAIQSDCFTSMWISCLHYGAVWPDSTVQSPALSNWCFARYLSTHVIMKLILGFVEWFITAVIVTSYYSLHLCLSLAIIYYDRVISYYVLHQCFVTRIYLLRKCLPLCFIHNSSVCQ